MPLWLVIAVLGIVEGITEFLPVSSTGHLLIAERWLHTKQSELFNIVIQSGAVLAVLPLFPERLRQFFFRWREPATRDYLLKILLPVAITAAVGFVLEKRGFKLQDNIVPIAIALFVGGVLFILVEQWLRGTKPGEQVTWGVAVAVGIAQLVAGVFPGTSRSGATILIALVLGLNRVAATEYTFLVGIPTMMGVSAWKMFKALHHPAAGAPQEDWGRIALGFIVAAIVSFIAVKWLLRYIQTHTFVVFGWYRIGLAGLLAALLLLNGPDHSGTARAVVPAQAEQLGDSSLLKIAARE
jgi:undecaprenyl-diphosphatase